MATFIFRSVRDGTKILASSFALNPAREKAVMANPDSFQLYDASLWPVWECWEGGKCIWHCDEEGNCISGPRPKNTPEKSSPAGLCAVCGQPQFDSPSGTTCSNGHGGADTVY